MTDRCDDPACGALCTDASPPMANASCAGSLENVDDGLLSEASHLVNEVHDVVAGTSGETWSAYTDGHTNGHLVGAFVGANNGLLGRRVATVAVFPWVRERSVEQACRDAQLAAWPKENAKACADVIERLVRVLRAEREETVRLRQIECAAMRILTNEDRGELKALLLKMRCEK